MRAHANKLLDVRITKYKEIELHKHLYSVPAIATYIGTGIALWSALQNYILGVAVTLGVLSIVLAIYLYFTNQKYKKYKPYKSIDSELHRLCHRTRDFITLLRCADDKNEVMHLADSAIRNALTSASHAFTKLTGHQCSASIMLKQSDGSLKTIQYCHNSDPQRESQPSDCLPTDSGVAGEALSTGNVVSWSKGDPKFDSTRSNFEDYYISGISAPFKSGFEYMGLLNIDCLEINKFNAKEYREISAMIADSIGLILGAKDLWVDLK